jgi:hypothetical protein
MRAINSSGDGWIDPKDWIIDTSNVLLVPAASEGVTS